MSLWLILYSRTQLQPAAGDDPRGELTWLEAEQATRPGSMDGAKAWKEELMPINTPMEAFKLLLSDVRGGTDRPTS